MFNISKIIPWSFLSPVKPKSFHSVCIYAAVGDESTSKCVTQPVTKPYPITPEDVSTHLMLETEYSGSGVQYHARCCPGAQSHQSISRHGIWHCRTYNMCCCSRVNSLWPSDAIWRHRSGSTLAQVMACCLTAPSDYLNQCWLIISKVHWHSSEGNFAKDTSATNH